ncbi:circadian clock protein PASD1 [Globicephala melas]|uniref:circadian clock protein PASD1 n=1 Tax=Globicephala melas TaxID=9731 RepID=UPI00293D7506|nr:circadian clock protein PASD1 [Globicephala melas]
MPHQLPRYPQIHEPHMVTLLPTTSHSKAVIPQCAITNVIKTYCVLGIGSATGRDTKSSEAQSLPSRALWRKCPSVLTLLSSQAAKRIMQVPGTAQPTLQSSEQREASSERRVASPDRTEYSTLRTFRTFSDTGGHGGASRAHCAHLLRKPLALSSLLTVETSDRKLRGSSQHQPKLQKQIEAGEAKPEREENRQIAEESGKAGREKVEGKDLFTVQESGEDVLLAPDSEEEHLPVDHRSVQGQRSSSGMELLHAEPDAPASEGRVNVVMVDQYGSQESARVIKRKSFTYYDSSTSTLETIPEPPAPLSLPSFEVKTEVEHVEQMDHMGEMEQVDEEKEVDKVDQVPQEDRETISFPSVTADVGNQSLHPPPSVIWYVNRREEELMKRFREQLEERTQMLRGEIWNQNHALEMLKEQLQSMQDSKLQIQPSTSRHIRSPEPQPLEPVPKKQCIGPMHRSLPDCKGARHFCGSCSSYSFRFPEELQQPCDASSQQPAQELVQYLPQQAGLQEQSQQHNVTVENRVLQILVPSQPNVSLPLDNTHMFTSMQHITVPVQLEAEQQPSSSYHGENPGGQEGRSHSFLLEDQQGPCLSPLLLAHNPSSEMISSTVIPQCQISSDSNLVMLQIPEDSNQLCQQPEDPQHHLYFQVETWPSSEQASLQDQVTWVQVPTPETEVQGSSGLQIIQDDTEHGPGQICYFMSAAPSNSYE